MTVETANEFAISELKRSYEQWDVPALLALYADDIELVDIDRDNPPSAPRVRRGRETLEGMFNHCAAAGVKASVENAVADGTRGAASITCEFPNGRKVLANALFEIAEGRIVREHHVTMGDPRD